MPEVTEYDYDVFISFASGDEELVRPIWQRLKERGIRAFWSAEMPKDRVGVSWFAVVQQAVESSHHLLLIWTNRSSHSSWVEREYVAFLHLQDRDRSRKLVPCLADGVDTSDLPLFLRGFQACRLGDPNLLHLFARLFADMPQSTSDRVRGDAPTVAPRRKPSTKSKKSPPLVQADEVLAAVLGSEPLLRSEATARFWDYIKAHDLQDQYNKRMINADDRVRPIFNKDQVSMFEMVALVNKRLRLV